MDEQRNNQDYDEIDLRDVFRTISRWKKTIIGITLGAMMLSAIISIFVIKPSYEATTVIALTSVSSLSQPNQMGYIVTDKNPEDMDFQYKLSDNVDNMVNLTQLNVNRYKEVLTSNHILQSVIDNLKLDSNPKALSGQINIESPKESPDVATIIVTASDPQMAAQIANTLVKEATQYLNQENSQRMQKLMSNLDSELGIAQAEMDRAYQELIEYNNGNVGRNELTEKKLSSEVELRENVVSALSTKIIQLKVSQSFYDAEEQLVVISAGVPQENPVKPNKMLNIAIAGVLGLMLAVFGVFFAEYMKEEEPMSLEN